VTGILVLESWQPRYFVLENGILSYYDSQDDVGKGSKGSIKMAVCEIKGKVFIGPHPAHYLGQAPVQHSHCLTWIGGK
uniref:PH domain-containing protein n=1 Tax=Varanus komodoensis TaxID=61221 RepID=A0A8D2J3G8_VARKO